MTAVGGEQTLAVEYVKVTVAVVGVDQLVLPLCLAVWASPIQPVPPHTVFS
jgi:hypothetical protein